MTMLRARFLAAATIVTLLAAPALVGAQISRFRDGEPFQRGYPPSNPDAPKLLVGSMWSASRELGADAGNKLRARLKDDHNANELTVIARFEINSTLEQSGFRPDSALGRNDLIELAKQRQATEAIAGTITKLGGDSVRWEPLLLVRSGQIIVPQPLPAITARNLDDAAKSVERAVEEAQKQIAGYTSCHNNVLGGKLDLAIKDAREAIKAYPQSTVARLCMVQAMVQMKAPTDSVIEAANAIVAIDPANPGALAILSDAYTTKGDTTKAIETEVKLYNADQSNQTLAQAIIQQLGASGAPQQAIPIIKNMLTQSPGDPAMLKVQWLLYMRAKDWKGAYTAGAEYVAADTSAANEDYYGRMVAAATADSNAAKQTEYLSAAVKKYPNNSEFQIYYANVLYKAGQLQQAIAPAEAALAINPKTPQGYTLLVLLFTQTKQPDSAMASGKRGVAAGADRASIGSALTALVSPALTRAQAQDATREDWMELLKVASTLDSIVPGPSTKFFIGLSSFQVGLKDFQGAFDLQRSTKPADKAKGCQLLKSTEDLWGTAQMNIVPGGAFNKDAAAQVMTAINQNSENILPLKARFCK